MQEEWMRWEPKKELVGNYNIDSVVMSEEQGLTIELFGEEQGAKSVKVLFEHAIDAYRYTNESFWFKTCSDLSKKYGKDFYADWSFFQVKNSEYLKWLSKKSCAYADEFSFMHFCIMGLDSVVEILARYEPTVTFIE